MYKRQHSFKTFLVELEVDLDEFSRYPPAPIIFNLETHMTFKLWSRYSKTHSSTFSGGLICVWGGSDGLESG